MIPLQNDKESLKYLELKATVKLWTLKKSIES